MNIRKIVLADGVRDASHNFEFEVEETCVAGGGQRGFYHRCTLKSSSKAPHHVSFLHHCDDLLFAGRRARRSKI